MLSFYDSVLGTQSPIRRDLLSRANAGEGSESKPNKSNRESGGLRGSHSELGCMLTWKSGVSSGRNQNRTATRPTDLSLKKSPAFNLMKTGPYALTTKVNCRYLLVPDQARSRTYRKQATTDRFLRTKCKKCAQSAHSRSAKTSKLPFFVGAGGFEPPASWSRKLRHSHKTTISGQFSKFELHEVHRISQTVHNLLTLTGGTIANQLSRGAMSGSVSARCIPIPAHLPMNRLVHAAVLARMEF